MFEETAAEVFPVLVTLNHKFRNLKELSRIKNEKSIPRHVIVKLPERAKMKGCSLKKRKGKKKPLFQRDINSETNSQPGQCKPEEDEKKLLMC